jgi:hypothetical protein
MLWGGHGGVGGGFAAQSWSLILGLGGLEEQRRSRDLAGLW